MLKSDFIASSRKGNDVYHKGEHAGEKYAYVQVSVQDYDRDKDKVLGADLGFWYKPAEFHFEEVNGKKCKVYDAAGGFRAVDTPEVRAFVEEHLIEGAKLAWKKSAKKSAPKAEPKAKAKAKASVFPAFDLSKLSPKERKEFAKCLAKMQA